MFHVCELIAKCCQDIRLVCSFLTFILVCYFISQFCCFRIYYVTCEV